MAYSNDSGHLLIFITFSRDVITNLVPQCRAFSGALKIGKLKAPLFPGPKGAVDSNDWYIIIASYIFSCFCTKRQRVPNTAETSRLSSNSICKGVAYHTHHVGWLTGISGVQTDTQVCFAKIVVHSVIFLFSCSFVIRIFMDVIECLRTLPPHTHKDTHKKKNAQRLITKNKS